MMAWDIAVDPELLTVENAVELALPTTPTEERARVV
jgi:hypothetical protein